VTEVRIITTMFDMSAATSFTVTPEAPTPSHN